MDSLAQIWEVAKSIGPGGIALLLYLFYQERKERQAKDKQIFDLATSGITAMNGVREAISRLRTSSRRGRR